MQDDTESLRSVLSAGSAAPIHIAPSTLDDSEDPFPESYGGFAVPGPSRPITSQQQAATTVGMKREMIDHHRSARAIKPDSDAAAPQPIIIDDEEEEDTSNASTVPPAATKPALGPIGSTRTYTQSTQEEESLKIRLEELKQEMEKFEERQRLAKAKLAETVIDLDSEEDVNNNNSKQDPNSPTGGEGPPDDTTAPSGDGGPPDEPMQQ